MLLHLTDVHNSQGWTHQSQELKLNLGLPCSWQGTQAPEFRQVVLKFDKVWFVVVVAVCALNVIYETTPNPRLQRFMPLGSFKIFIFLALIFQSVIHFMQLFIWCEEGVQLHSFARCLGNVFRTILWSCCPHAISIEITTSSFLTKLNFWLNYTKKKVPCFRRPGHEGCSSWIKCNLL